MPLAAAWRANSSPDPRRSPGDERPRAVHMLIELLHASILVSCCSSCRTSFVAELAWVYRSR